MTSPSTPDHEVLIVGAGPVGLFLGCRLQQLGIRCLVLEREAEPWSHSRAIGIHPPSLERLEELGVVDAFLALGVPVPGGAAVSNHRVLGHLTFESCPKPYNFALSLPQGDTEAILEQQLLSLEPRGVRRGLTVTEVEDEDEVVTVRAVDGAGEAHLFRSSFVVGCDGTQSVVRRFAGVPFDGAAYPDSFVMGDFADDTDFGSEACLFLAPEGLVESFPLPEGRRRWVASTDEYIAEPTLDDLVPLVLERTGHDLAGQSSFMLGPFRIERFLAARFVAGRLILAGDAAHVMSPIGGQGMNTGWMDAWDLAGALHDVLRQGEPWVDSLARYARQARRRAARVIRRAEFNTTMGRSWRYPAFKTALVWLMLHSPARSTLSRIFTMRGL